MNFTKHRWIILTLLTLALFFACGGLQLHDALNISYHEILKPIPSNPNTFEKGSVVFSAEGTKLWWTRTSVKTEEQYRFYVWHKDRGWGMPILTRKFSAREFGDKNFFRQPLALPPMRPAGRTWIKLELQAERMSPETRVAMVDVRHTANWHSLRDVIRLAGRLIFCGWLSFGGLWLGSKRRQIGRWQWHWDFTNFSGREAMAAALGIAWLVRWLMATRVYGSSSDILFWLTWAEAAHQHLNLYAHALGFDKGPLLLGICAAARQLSDWLGYSFTYTCRWLSLAADLIITGIVVKWCRDRGTTPLAAFGFGLLYALNPVSLAVFLHGQLDALPIACLLLAAYLLSRPQPRSAAVMLAGMALGLGAGIKLYVVLIIPLMLWRQQRLSQRVWLVAACGAAWLLPMVVYGQLPASLSAMFRYSGGYPGSWSISVIPTILKGINAVGAHYQHAPWFPPALMDAWINLLSRPLGFFSLPMWLLLLAWGWLYWRVLPKLSLEHAWVLICLTYFVVGQNIAPQYWSWLIAAGVITAAQHKTRLPWIRRYSLYFGMAYLALLAVDRNLLLPVIGVRLDVPWLAAWIIGMAINGMLWVFCLVWWGWELRQMKTQSLLAVK